jgi:transglutaminase-like putative cysteine protease
MTLRKFVLVLLLIATAPWRGDAGGDRSRDRLAPAAGRFAHEQARDRHRAFLKALSHSRVVEFELSYDFFVPGKTRNIDFTVLVPRTMPDRQNILSVTYAPQPSRVFEQDGNRYAEFTFGKPNRHEKVKISVKAELFKYDLLTARLNRIGSRRAFGGQPGAEADNPEDYLKAEKYIEKDHRLIRRAADGIEGGTEIDVVKNIYDYVLDHIEYSILGRKDWGAIKALELGKGDCTEYSDLFVALCRAKNIPARVVSGYAVGYSPSSSRHNWTEVYLHDYGWIPFDPSAGDVKSTTARDNAFSSLQPMYIYLSHVRNDPVLHNYSFGVYTYRGDKIKYTDSVEFKQSAPAIPDSR